MKWIKLTGLAGLCVLTAFLGAGCSGGSSGKSPAVGVRSGRTNLIRVDFGRLVDVYSWDRKVSNQAAKDPSHRKEVLYQRDVVIGQGITSDDNNYLLREVDPVTGKAQLLIKWDRVLEATQFHAALTNAEQAVERVQPSKFSQNTGINPFDVVPRNAALKLTFGAILNLPDDYAIQNPGFVQLLEITGNPETDPPTKAFRSIPARVVIRGNAVILDPVIVGREEKAQPGLKPNPYGLPASPNSSGANIRIAIPVDNRLGGFPIKLAGDVIPEGGKDRRGRLSVIRDFRSGNRGDDHNGFLFDETPPHIVGEFQFGILAVDPKANTLTLNKRARLVTLRSRKTGPEGRSGDEIVQEVKSPKTGEIVRIKAEIDDPNLHDSSTNAVVTVRVNTLEGYDSKGNRVTFQASNSPLGADCNVKVLFDADQDDPSLFLSFSPSTSLRNPTSKVNPMASVTITFSEPLAPESLSAFDTLLLSTSNNPAIVRDPKLGTQSLIVANLVPDPSTGMSVRLVPPLGFNHVKGKTNESVYLMVMAPKDGRGVTDLAGNKVDLRSKKKDALVASFTLDPDAETNAVANIVHRFISADEDGTPREIPDFGPVLDFWGQFSMKDSRLYASPTVRFVKYAEESTLRAVFRGDKGECMNKGKPMGGFPLYITPRNVFQPPPPYKQTPTGGVFEPFDIFGSRLQMTYREDDFRLSYTDPADMELDVEQMSWASFMGNPILYDVFDRVTLYLSHCERRPDLRAQVVSPPPPAPPQCIPDPTSLNSGLQVKFKDNVLDGSKQVPVFEDVEYAMNPNNSFKNAQGILYLPYPKFQRTYTWRDRRLSKWDVKKDKAVGLGGIAIPGKETTTDVPNPWFQINPNAKNKLPLAPPQGDAAFRGDVVDGLHPIALPLLLDFLVYPDDPNKHGGRSTSLNRAMIAVVWYLWPGIPGVRPHGYYLQPGNVLGRNLPGMRAHTTGGVSPTGVKTIVDPKNTFVAKGGWIVDPSLSWVNGQFVGPYQAPPVDDHVPWARIDLLRKVSIVTGGFVDLTRPNKNKISGTPSDGSPVWDANSYRPTHFEVVTEPPLEDMPGGTNTLVEWRGVEVLPNDQVYDPAAANMPDKRGNLLNPLYACDAYRLAAIKGHSIHIDAKGFTNYHKDPQDLVNPATGFGPRYVNWRIVFTNNTTSVPPLRPYLDSLGLAVRMGKKQ